MISFSRDFIPFARIINPFNEILFRLHGFIFSKIKHNYICPKDTTVFTNGRPPWPSG